MFERRNTSLHLTKRGELLLRHAEQFVHLAELVDRDVTDPQGAEGHLRLGVSETIAQCWLPELIKKLSHIYPNLAVEINVDIFTVLREALLNQEIDLAILLGPILEFSVDNIELPRLSWLGISGRHMATRTAHFPNFRWRPSPGTHDHTGELNRPYLKELVPTYGFFHPPAFRPVFGW